MTVDEAFAVASQMHQAGQLAEAETLYRQILLQNASHLNANYMLSLALYERRQFAEALPLIVRAIELLPAVGELHGHRGLVLAALGKTEEAIIAYGRALELKPEYPQALFNLAGALCLAERWLDAIGVYARAGELGPHDVASLGHLGRALIETHQYDAAIAVYKEYLNREPRGVDGWNNLACAYKDTGRVAKAIEYYQKAIEIDPARADLASNRIYAMHFDPRFDSAAIGREHRDWNQRYAEPLAKTVVPVDRDRDPGRRLRIGYVSPDLRNHVVGRTLLPVLEQHDPRQVEIYAYSSAAKSDGMTGQLESHCDEWREIHGVGDERAAQMIREDRIDILIDLTLHMAGHRLLVFARKPAPIQVTYLGYCSTTGLAAMDYRISDPHLDPVGTDLSVYTEKTVRLPESWWCYRPTGATPAVGEGPIGKNGYVTFGCLNNFAKVSGAALECWAGILAKARGSRLVLHCPAGSHRTGVLEVFAGRGVGPDRIEFVDYQEWPPYMRTYQRIDVVLDPFPYGGGITTCDALWMGVPVVTLSGRTAVGRGGRSLLTNAGLAEMVAATEQEYGDLAVQYDRWTSLRPTLRDRLAGSPVSDATRLARDLEAVYRGMWDAWTKRVGWTRQSPAGNENKNSAITL